MKWQLDWSGSESFFKTILEDTGKPHPAAAAKPALRGEDIEYYDAFCLLGASRIWDQVGPQPLQISETVALLDGMGIRNYDQRERYIRYVRKMDSVEMAHLSEQLKRARNSK